MELLDPATGAALPPDAIQRVLFVAPRVHVYAIPPLTSMRGHVASSWTSEIFSARARILETSSSSSSSSGDGGSSIKVDVVLEDPATGQLFAAAPYADPAVVEPATDSSRFFALTVRDPQGRKATLGIGFEERPEAFDFAVALQEARRALGLEAAAAGGRERQRSGADGKTEETAPAKDYSLKEGETITVNIGGKFGRRRQQQQQQQQQQQEEGEAGASLQSFALAPPPPPPSSSASSSAAEASKSEGSGGFALPPPPSAQDVKSKRKSLLAMGFDDGQFGEFA
ncbi:adaptin ear-binding coat-associated protein 2 [Cordyceps fumosorosea ARSEF 2679]|uniref:Adaptin ear-binding coat-associated protein 2 n=1 Tax=Cordyceps fumosorosea (strain ARSEF 2679) TaxID=1081104 RepID=A0A167R653_CORFA|nr:adaptin ear-binding coat-associated protein 2 [Cordyceps fumosorosea ARSEF 2679]OAA58306.1 adaptin ear-binding coat-associated protein 2 [Cordyceps fumosorosea ARSEF 2679]